MFRAEVMIFEGRVGEARLQGTTEFISMGAAEKPDR
jgi:hypothetical protein